MILVELVGLVAALALLVRLPAPGRAVELAVDLTAVRRYAAARDQDPGQVLDAFRQAGATTALVGEKTLYDLLVQGQAGYPPTYPVRIQVAGGGELQTAAAAGLAASLPPGAAQPDETYIFIRDNPDLAGWLEAALGSRLGAARVRRVPASADPGLVLLAVRAGPLPVRPPNASPLLLMPLGHLPADVDLVRRHGLAVAYGVGDPVPSLGRMPLRAPDPAGGAGNLIPGRPVYVEGTEVPGHPGREREFGMALVQSGATLALPTEVALPAGPGPLPAVAAGGPAGAAVLATTPGLTAVRAHRTRVAEGPADWLRLAGEGGVRFFVFGVWPSLSPGEQDLERQLGLLSAFRDSLGGLELHPGLAVPAPQAGAGWAGVLAAAGVAASAVHLVLRFWVPGPDAAPGTYAATLAASLVAVAACAWAWAAGAWPVREAIARLPLVTWPALGVMAAAAAGLDEQVLTADTVARRGGRAFDPGSARDRALLGRMLLHLVPYAVAGGVAARALAGLLPSPSREPEPALVLAPAAAFLLRWAWLRGPRLARDLAAAGDRTVRVGHLILLGAAVALPAAGLVAALRPAAGGAAQPGAELAPPPTAPGWPDPAFRAPVAPLSPARGRTGVSPTARAVLAARYLAPRPAEVLVGYPALGAAAWLLRRGRARAGLWAVAAAGLGAGVLAVAVANPWVPLWREAARAALAMSAGGVLAIAVQGVLSRRWEPGRVQVTGS